MNRIFSFGNSSSSKVTAANASKLDSVPAAAMTNSGSSSFAVDGYPAVDPATMATLEELLDHPLLVEEVKEAFAKAFETKCTVQPKVVPPIDIVK